MEMLKEMKISPGVSSQQVSASHTIEHVLTLLFGFITSEKLCICDLFPLYSWKIQRLLRCSGGGTNMNGGPLKQFICTACFILYALFFFNKLCPALTADIKGTLFGVELHINDNTSFSETYTNKKAFADSRCSLQTSNIWKALSSYIMRITLHLLYVSMMSLATKWPNEAMTVSLF